MDAFSLLGLPRRPWLDPDEVRAAFQEKSRALHPDAPGGDAAAFAALNAAQQTLASPAARLRLLAGNAPIPAAPPDVDFAFRLGGQLRVIDAALAKVRSARLGLERALAVRELVSLRGEVEKLSAELRSRLAAAEERLRGVSLDQPAALAALAAEFTYLDRWTAQLRERQLELQITLSQK